MSGLFAILAAWIGAAGFVMGWLTGDCDDFKLVIESDDRAVTTLIAVCLFPLLVTAVPTFYFVRWVKAS